MEGQTEPQKRGLRDFEDRTVAKTFFTGSMAQLHVTNGIDSIFPSRLSMLAQRVCAHSKIKSVLRVASLMPNGPF